MRHRTATSATLGRWPRLFVLCALVAALLAVGSTRAPHLAAQSAPALSADDEAWVVQTAAQLYADHRNDADYRGLDATSLQQPLRDCLIFAQANTTLAASAQRANCRSQVGATLVFVDPSDALDATASAAAAPLVNLLPADVVQNFVSTLRACLAGYAIGRSNSAVATVPRTECPAQYQAIDQSFIDAITPLFLAAVPTDQFPNYDAAKTEQDFRTCLATKLSALGGYADAQQTCTRITLQHLLTPPPIILSLGCPGSLTDQQGFSCTPSFDPSSTVTGTQWSVAGGDGSGDALATLSDTNPTFAGLTYRPFGYTITLTACNDNADSCTTMSQLININLAAPVVGAPGCAGDAVLNQADVCTASGASGTFPSTTWTWSATNGTVVTGSKEGESSTASVTFSSTGSQTVTLTACNPPGGDGQCVTVSQTINVTSVPAPSIDSIGCNPQQGTAPLNVYCTASVSGTTGAISESWSAPGGDTASGQGPTFGTSFSKQGTYTITFHACNGASCATDQTFTIAVTGPQAPKLGAISCAPSTPNVGDTVSCSVAFDQSNPPTSFAWQSTGTPANGTDTSFVTKFTSTGTQTISVNACVGDQTVSANCASASLSVVVGQAMNQIGPPMCTPQSPSTGAPVNCSVSYDALHPPTQITWSASGGSPASGSGPTFLTGFSNPGTANISVTACFGATNCTTQSTSVNVVKGSASGGSNSITGTWNANNGVWSFTQTGSNVTGSIAFSGGNGSATFSGTVMNGTVQLNWQCNHDCPIPSSGGTVTLTVAPNGCSMQGTYKTNALGMYVGSGPLNMTKQGCQ